MCVTAAVAVVTGYHQTPLMLAALDPSNCQQQQQQQICHAPLLLLLLLLPLIGV
jgi:hypothetical protein